MTEPEPSSQARECGADVAAYALDALGHAEVAAFRHHLETCAVCQDELASFQQVVDVLPIGVPEHQAPRALRRRVLAELRHEGARHSVARRRISWRLPSSFATGHSAVARGGMLAAVVIVVGGLQLGSSDAGRTQVFHAQVVGTSGAAEIRVTAGHAELLVHRFAAPPAGEIYEVWLARPDRTPRPTGALFSVTASGDVDVAVRGNLHGVQQVMVTREPAGGSSVPTQPAVITADLT